MIAAIEQPLASWQHCWRVGVAPLLTQTQLKALAAALERDDPRLLQNATTDPPPLHINMDWPCDCACFLAFLCLAENPEATAGDVEEFFAQICKDIDTAMGERAGCRYLTNFWDETPRQEARTLLLAEIRRSLEG